MNKKVVWVFIVVVALIALLGVWYYASTHSGTQAPPAAITPLPTPVPSPTPSSTPTASPSLSAAPVVGPGEHCGGNILNAPVCSSGYTCVPEPNSHLPFGDVGGVCAPAGGKG